MVGAAEPVLEDDRGSGSRIVASAPRSTSSSVPSTSMLMIRGTYPGGSASSIRSSDTGISRTVAPAGRALLRRPLTPG